MPCLYSEAPEANWITGMLILQKPPTDAALLAKQHYSKEMENICGAGKPYIHAKELARQHDIYFQEALEMFREKTQNGDINSLKQEEQLKCDLNEICKKLKSFNESTNIFLVARTPLALLSAILVIYFLRHISINLGFDRIELISTIIMFVLFGMVLFWLYAEYTGKYKSEAMFVDVFAGYIIEFTKTITGR